MTRDRVFCVKKIRSDARDEMTLGGLLLFSPFLFKSKGQMTHRTNLHVNNVAHISGKYASIQSHHHTPPM